MRNFLVFAVVTTGVLVSSLLWSTTACPTAELRFGVHPNIMCLELPFTGARADATLALWRAGDGSIARAARRDTIADYGFLLLYGAALAATGRQASRRLAGVAPRERRVLIASPLGAALFDALENQGIFHMLAASAPTGDAVAALTSALATLKFALLILWVATAAKLAVRARNSS